MMETIPQPVLFSQSPNHHEQRLPSIFDPILLNTHTSSSSSSKLVDSDIGKKIQLPSLSATFPFLNQSYNVSTSCHLSPMTGFHGTSSLNGSESKVTGNASITASLKNSYKNSNLTSTMDHQMTGISMPNHYNNTYHSLMQQYPYHHPYPPTSYPSEASHTQSITSLLNGTNIDHYQRAGGNMNGMPSLINSRSNSMLCPTSYRKSSIPSFNPHYQSNETNKPFIPLNKHAPLIPAMSRNTSNNLQNKSVAENSKLHKLAPTKLDAVNSFEGPKPESVGILKENVEVNAHGNSYATLNKGLDLSLLSNQHLGNNQQSSHHNGENPSNKSSQTVEKVCFGKTLPPSKMSFSTTTNDNHDKIKSCFIDRVHQENIFKFPSSYKKKDIQNALAKWLECCTHQYQSTNNLAVAHLNAMMDSMMKMIQSENKKVCSIRKTLDSLRDLEIENDDCLEYKMKGNINAPTIKDSIEHDLDFIKTSVFESLVTEIVNCEEYIHQLRLIRTSILHLLSLSYKISKSLRKYKSYKNWDRPKPSTTTHRFKTSKLKPLLELISNENMLNSIHVKSSKASKKNKKKV